MRETLRKAEGEGRRERAGEGRGRECAGDGALKRERGRARACGGKRRRRHARNGDGRTCVHAGWSARPRQFGVDKLLQRTKRIVADSPCGFSNIIDSLGPVNPVNHCMSEAKTQGREKEILLIAFVIVGIEKRRFEVFEHLALHFLLRCLQDRVHVEETCGCGRVHVDSIT